MKLDIQFVKTLAFLWSAFSSDSVLAISSCCNTDFNRLNKTYIYLLNCYSTVPVSVFYEDTLSHIYNSSQIFIPSVRIINLVILKVCNKIYFRIWKTISILENNFKFIYCQIISTCFNVINLHINSLSFLIKSLEFEVVQFLLYS